MELELELSWKYKPQWNLGKNVLNYIIIIRNNTADKIIKDITLKTTNNNVMHVEYPVLYIEDLLTLNTILNPDETYTFSCVINGIASFEINKYDWENFPLLTCELNFYNYNNPEGEPIEPIPYSADTPLVAPEVPVVAPAVPEVPVVAPVVPEVPVVAPVVVPEVPAAEPAVAPPAAVTQILSTASLSSIPQVIKIDAAVATAEVPISKELIIKIIDEYNSEPQTTPFIDYLRQYMQKEKEDLLLLETRAEQTWSADFSESKKWYSGQSIGFLQFRGSGTFETNNNIIKISGYNPLLLIKTPDLLWGNVDITFRIKQDNYSRGILQVVIRSDDYYKQGYIVNIDFSGQVSFIKKCCTGNKSSYPVSIDNAPRDEWVDYKIIAKDYDLSKKIKLELYIYKKTYTDPEAKWVKLAGFIDHEGLSSNNKPCALSCGNIFKPSHNILMNFTEFHHSNIFLEKITVNSVS